MNPLRNVLDRWLGRGAASITVPPMDGAFRPNDRLDAASPVLELPAPDDLALTARGLVVSSGRSLIGLDRPDASPLAVFDAEIGALAGLPDGGVAVGLADGRIVLVGGQHDGRIVPASADIGCITALAPADDGALLVANGSTSNAPGAWKRDLMQRNASGSVWRIDLAGAERHLLAAGLAYPYGLLDDGGSVIVSESWSSALMRIRPGSGGRPTPVLENLPAYPSRLSRAADGTIWLALFAPRSQIVEFVLTEDRFRRRMTDDVDPEFWVAPSLRAGRMPQEPTQQGGVKQLGVLKPWSPTRSCGLVVRLDSAYRPNASFHSRASGRRHGVTACLSRAGRLYVCAKGDGVVAALEHGDATP